MLFRSARAILLVSVALLCLVTCVHDWDALEAPADGNGDGGDGSGGSLASDPATMCAHYCATVENCVESEPNCEDDCVSDLASCTPGQRDSIADCLEALTPNSCVAVCAQFVGFAACMLGQTITCWLPPVVSC